MKYTKNSVILTHGYSKGVTVDGFKATGYEEGRRHMLYKPGKSNLTVLDFNHI